MRSKKIVFFFPAFSSQEATAPLGILAVSLVTGPMIRETAQIARAAKALYPDLPVVLGGWHPSLLPDQTLAAECIDVVVRGQGEEALLEVVQRLEDRASLK